jgi:hypothetical protein
VPGARGGTPPLLHGAATCRLPPCPQTFSGYRLYVAPEPFEQDVHLHRVQPGTPYGWQPGVTRELFGWEVVEQGSLEVPAPLPSMRRLHRSVYVLDAQPCQAGHHGRA